MSNQDLYPHFPDRHNQGFDDTTAVMDEVERFFVEETNHHPSQGMMEALADIPRAVFDIVNGTAARAYHLSSLDCGVGKTTTLRYTIAALRNKGYPAGIVLCLGRLRQIEAMAHDLQLQEDEYAILVAKGQRTRGSGPFKGALFSDLGLGEEGINQAPILLTTHAMVEKRLSEAHGKTWTTADEFFFQGEPRQLRVWDEAVFVRQGVSVDIRDLLRIAAELDDLRIGIFEFVSKVRDAEPDTILEVPDYQAVMDLQSVFAQLTMSKRNELGDAIQNFWLLSGRPVLIRRDWDRNIIIQYQTNLPDDMKPMLVLDASARVRETYRQQHLVDKDIISLRTCPKRYDRVRVHFEKGGSGRTTFGNKFDKRINQVVEIIRQHPTRKPLILFHQPSKAKKIRDTEAEVMARLSTDGLKVLTDVPEVKFCHWGMHTSVNDYADCDLIIAISTFREPVPVVEARGRAAANRPVDQEYRQDELRAMHRGELLHNLLQGLSRGAIRNLEGDQAQECHVYLMATDPGLIDDVKATLFPGCTILNGWGLEEHPEKSDLTPNGIRILQLIDAAFDDEQVQIVSAKDIGERLGIKQTNMSRYMNEPQLRVAVHQMGLAIVPGKGRSPTTVIRQPDFSQMDDEGGPIVLS